MEAETRFVGERAAAWRAGHDEVPSAAMAGRREEGSSAFMTPVASAGYKSSRRDIRATRSCGRGLLSVGGTTVMNFTDIGALPAMAGEEKEREMTGDRAKEGEHKAPERASSCFLPLTRSSCMPVHGEAALRVVAMDGEQPSSLLPRLW